jgi:hypothetical protein
LWPWARSRRAPWTTLDAAAAAALSPRRTRAIVAALHAAGLLDCVREAELAGQDGQTAAEWTVSEAGRQVLAPILIVNGETRAIIGIRVGAPVPAAP